MSDNAAATFSIRPFASADEEAVVALWQDCALIVPWNDPRRDIRLKQAWQPQLFFVGTLDESLIGSVMAGYDGHRGWINYLAVAPHHQGKGYGRALMHHAEAALGALGCPKINLQVRRTNTPVVAFYQALGFTEDTVVSLGKRL